MAFAILGGGAVTAEFYLPALRLLGLAETGLRWSIRSNSLAPLRATFPEVTVLAMDHAAYLNGLAPTGEERVVVALPNSLHVEAVELALLPGRPCCAKSRWR